MMKSLVLATGNAGKVRELSGMLGPLGWRVRPQSEWGIEAAVEDGLTFIENALIKARHAAQHTGLPSLGDDSGLVVDILEGAPGIYSSRYAGENASDGENCQKLLNALQGVAPEQRSAHFYCAMALVRYPADPAPLLATGAWHGLIADSERGSGGFGYDPLFWVEGHGRTAAELSQDIKNSLSHRGQALAALIQQLRNSSLDHDWNQ